MSHPIPKPGILSIAPYVGGESVLKGVETVRKLSSNEGPLGASPLALAAYRDLSARLHRYPDGHCVALRRAIAERHELDMERIVCGNGSDEMIGLLCHAYAGPGDEVLHSAHGFLMYAIYAKSAGATPVAAKETDLTTDVDALLAAVTPRTKVVFVANPNNPTGTYIDIEDMTRLRAGLRSDILLVIDAAYAEFVEAPGYSDGQELVDALGANTVMTRTFSKLHGLGGIRLGWAYCPPSIADVLNRARSPFNVSAPAQAAGVAAMEDVSFQMKAKAHNDDWLPWLSRELEGLGLHLTPSVANFVLAGFKDEAQATDADAYLRAHGIIVRRMGAYGLPHTLRITIGLPEDNRAVTEAVENFMEAQRG